MTACCRVLLPLVLVAGVFGSAPAEETKAITLMPKWKKGDTLRYEMTRTQSRLVDGKEVRKTASRTPLEVEVMDCDEDGSVVRWTQGSTVFDDPKLDNEPFLKTMNAILKGTDIELELDNSGEFVGVRNWKELKATGTKIRDSMLEQLGKSGTSKDVLAVVRTESDKMLATKESIEQSFTTLPVMMFSVLGTSYDTKPGTYEAELPNPFGGEAFPTKGEYLLKSLDKTGSTAVVVIRQSPEPKEQNRILKQTLDDLAKKSGKPAQDTLPEFKLDDVVEYEVDVKTGWVRLMIHTRTMKLDKSTQVEELKITRRDH